MKTYYDIRREIVRFLNESDINAYDLMRVSKDLCSCRTCRFFRQHYSQDGEPLDFGHCCKNNIPQSKKPNMQSCGFWEMSEVTETDEEIPNEV